MKTTEELGQLLRDSREKLATMNQMYYFPTSAAERRYAEQLLPFQEKYINHLQAKMELQHLSDSSDSANAKTRRSLEAVIQEWEKEFEPQFEEMKEDIRRWTKSKPVPNTPAIKKHVWKGKVYHFGEWVETAYKSGYLSATSFSDALKHMCEHFVQKNGDPMDPRSVQQSLNQFRDQLRNTSAKKTIQY
jgi:hypothetical protein